MHIPEGDPSLQARRKANRRLDQREELLEEALQLTIAHCYILPRLPRQRRASDLPHLAFPRKTYRKPIEIHGTAATIRVPISKATM